MPYEMMDRWVDGWIPRLKQHDKMADTGTQPATDTKRVLDLADNIMSGAVLRLFPATNLSVYSLLLFSTESVPPPRG
jgi:hypothetical protein